MHRQNCWRSITWPSEYSSKRSRTHSPFK